MLSKECGFRKQQLAANWSRKQRFPKYVDCICSEIRTRKGDLSNSHMGLKTDMVHFLPAKSDSVTCPH